MLKQASISQIKHEEIPRKNSHIVIAMRYYPRFVRKELRDEFLCCLAPEKQLLKEFNEARKQLDDHDSAFAAVDYNSRFTLGDEAMEHLERLAGVSHGSDVYLACICKVGEMCHREILLLTAKHYFSCPVGDVYHRYPEFMNKLV